MTNVAHQVTVSSGPKVRPDRMSWMVPLHQEGQFGEITSAFKTATQLGKIHLLHEFSDLLEEPIQVPAKAHTILTDFVHLLDLSKNLSFTQNQGV